MAEHREPPIAAPATGGATRRVPGRMLDVAVTGHRSDRLSPPVIATVRAAMSELLARLERESVAAETAFPGDRSPGPGRVRLHSMLASGADTAAAEAALAAGTELHAILPFARARYAEDFAPGGERQTFQALLDRAATVVEPADAAPDDYPYERGGHLLVAACDLIIAVWDGGEGRGRGGTAAVVAHALSQGRPVIVMPPDRPRETTLTWPGHGLAVGEAAAGPGGTVPVGPVLGALVRELLAARTRPALGAIPPQKVRQGGSLA